MNRLKLPALLLAVWLISTLIYSASLSDKIYPLKCRADTTEANVQKLAQNDSTFATIINHLHRRIKALEQADSVKAVKK